MANINERSIEKILDDSIVKVNFLKKDLLRIKKRLSPEGKIITPTDNNQQAGNAQGGQDGKDKTK